MKKAPVLKKHCVVLNEMRKNGGSLGDAMIAAGYHKTYASKSGQKHFVKGLSWQQLMDRYIPQEKLAIRHNELLDKRSYRKVEQDGETMIVDDGPETGAVSKALEMAYKLRGSFVPEEKPANNGVVYNMFYQPIIQERVKAFEDALKESISNESVKGNPLLIPAAKSTPDESPAPASS